MGKYILWIAVVLTFLGAFYAFLPHAFHSAGPVGFEAEHTTHILTGIPVFIAGVLLLVFREKIKW